MPFEVKSMLELRLEFVRLATREGANVRALCRRYRISPDTGYRLIQRYREGGEAALADRSRRPHTSPRRTPPEQEAAVLAVRAAHPTWGGRKIAAWLARHGQPSPVPSTITEILRRHDQLTPLDRPARAWQRFERAAPNELWQLDFLGHQPLGQGRVHPLTVLDDHSRFGLGLVALAAEQGTLVQPELIARFRRYGLPEAILADHGPPWGAARPDTLTWLAAWLIRLGIRVYHGRPLHPQPRGKIERWHRTIETDLFAFQVFADLAAAQHAFDRFRIDYNTDRPHDGIGLAVPADRYQPSPRTYPEDLPAIVYSDDHQVCRVHQHGTITFAGRVHFISEALQGLPVGVRPTATDGVFVVRFCDQPVRRLDLREPSP